MTESSSREPSRWYVLHCKPKQELRAEGNLRARGLETLAPRIREWRHTGSSSAYCDLPLFPGYIFARFDADLLFAKVRFTRGVHSIVGFGQGATPLDDSVIAMLRSRMDETGCVSGDEPKSGDWVEIVDGPLRSMIGVFDRHLSGRDRVLILLTTLGCAARVQVARSAVRSVHSVS